MTEFERERDEAAEEFNNDVWGGEEDRCFIMSFKRGADWANARSEKRIQELEADYEHAHEAAKAYALKCGQLRAEIERINSAMKRVDDILFDMGAEYEITAMKVVSLLGPLRDEINMGNETYNGSNDKENDRG